MKLAALIAFLFLVFLVILILRDLALRDVLRSDSSEKGKP